MFDQLQAQGQRFAKENASTILTAAGVVGTVATAVLTGQASYKAAELIALERDLIEEAGEETGLELDLTKIEKVKVVWTILRDSSRS